MTLFEIPSPGMGGYFQLEIPESGPIPYPQAKFFQSARAAFGALLRAGKPHRVWMPRLICNAMLMPLKILQVPIAWYDLDAQMAIQTSFNLGPREWLLYVNYFGVGQKNIDDLLRNFPAKRIVLDYSQSFYEKPRQTLATIYSPRKFFGVPDGGGLVSASRVPVPGEVDDGSMGRMSHLFRRLGGDLEGGYRAFQRAENSLKDCEPKRMSVLTHRLLGSIDFKKVKETRLRNFRILHRHLGRLNRFVLDPKGISSPLCYPFQTNKNNLRKKLIQNKIFVPTYWADAAERVSSSWAQAMIHNLLPLPIDQRYSGKDMMKIVSVVLGRSR